MLICRPGRRYQAGQKATQSGRSKDISEFECDDRHAFQRATRLAPSAPQHPAERHNPSGGALRGWASHFLPFGRTTSNWWNNSGFAVLVAIADLIETRDPKVAKVYLLLTFDPLKREDGKKNADDHQAVPVCRLWIAPSDWMHVFQPLALVRVLRGGRVRVISLLIICDPWMKGSRYSWPRRNPARCKPVREHERAWRNAIRSACGSVEFVILVVAAFTRVEIGKIVHEFDGRNPLDHLEA